MVVPSGDEPCTSSLSGAAFWAPPPYVLVSPDGLKMTVPSGGSSAVEVYCLPPYQIDRRYCVYSHKTHTVSGFTSGGVFLHYKLKQRV